MNPSDERTLLTATEFTDRVMTAIALLPMPSPTRTFVAALRARAVRDGIAALWVAWHLGTVRTWHVAPRVRARSFALVLAVASVLATGGLAAAAAVHSVVPHGDDRNPVSAPSGSGIDELGPTTNGQTGTDGTKRTNDADQSPTTSDEPDATDEDGRGSTVDRSDDADEDADGDESDDADDHDSDDEDHPGDGDEPDETDDHEAGSGDDVPAATDDHDQADDADDPDESNEPDETDDHDGASGGDDAPDGDGELESDRDGSG
jgi:hypothetical protein